MNEQGLIDSELVARVQRGDKAAFDLLVRKYQNRIVRLVSRYIRDADEALDVAQESFIKAYRAIAGFRGESAFYTWLYRIAINTAKNHLSSRKKEFLESELNLGEAESLDDLGLMPDRVSPESLLLTEELRKTIFSTIDGLPEEIRTAILLREMECLSYEEIAEVMSCPIGTVRSRIFRARDAIDKRILPLLET